MKSITDFALNNSRTVVVMILVIFFGGIILFGKIPKLEDPFIIIREAVVVTKNPGMTVEEIERLITRPIEEQIKTMGEVDDIEDSTSKVGESLIHVTIKDEVPAEDLPMVWKLLRNYMSDLEMSLPEGTIGPMVNDTFGDTCMATIALWSDGFSMAEMRETARDIRERINLMKGIMKIDLTGVQEERIYIEYSNAKLAQLGIDPKVIGHTLRQQNTVQPSGRININGTEIIVETLGSFKSIEEIGDVLIPVEGTQAAIPLRDIAGIRKTYVDPIRNPAYYNGHQAIVLSVFLFKGVDAVAFGERLKKEVKKIEQSLALGYKLDFATFQPELISKSVNGMVSNVIQAVAIVVAVVMILLGLRTGLIVGAFIPLVMLFGVVMMSALNIEMQRVSLATMIIALGMFVDNAIVVSDDIKVNLESGMDRKDAVLKSGGSLSLPLLTSTLTTVFAFGPIILQIGSTGDYTKSMGQVMIILLLGSWFLSMFASTSFCYWFMKKPAVATDKKEAVDPYQGKFYQAYRKILVFGLRHQLLVLGVVGVFFALSVYGFTKIPRILFPDGDRNQYTIYLDYPAGTHIETTDRSVRDLCAWLQDKEKNPEITGSIAYVANGGPRFFLSLSPIDPDPNNAFVIVNTQTGDQVAELITRTRQHLLAHFPRVHGRVKAMYMGSSEPGLMEIRLSGPDIDVLLEQAEQLQAGLRKIPGTLDIKDDWNNRVISAKIEVDQYRARRAGKTSQEVAGSLGAFVDGYRITDFHEGNVDIPIVGRGLKTERDTTSSLSTINIYSQTNTASVPIGQVANVYQRGELNRIVRYNQERTITVSAKSQVLKAVELFGQIKPTLDQLDFPEKHHWEHGGELEGSAEAMEKLSKPLLPCFAAIVILLVWQFNSIRRAAIILLTMPLVLVGAVAGLRIMGADFGFMAILGLLALAGSIVNNGIVMIDKIEQNRREGQSPYDAVINSAISRFRPILLSVSTTMLGFTPLIIYHDALFYNMACVMFFGLGIGSLFTLNYVPSLYALFFRIEVPKEQVGT
ncbi:MAG TPA: efflux RND transporter permease subunit [Desulfobacteraceae bacterium]|nr:efflux RND transporter permease subunit [Desulfobacteraceae bacterium]